MIKDREWNNWNCSLWVDSDYSMELQKREILRKVSWRAYPYSYIKEQLTELLLDKETPDGAIYDDNAIMEIASDWEEEVKEYIEEV